MENPNYYSIIPASVRYDKNLKANEKLLYSEITALCNKEGVCWATNNYFANLYNVSTTSISVWIKNLIDCGYISRELIYKNGSKEILKRCLRILEGGVKENLKGGIKENLKENNTSMNTTSIIRTPTPLNEIKYPERGQNEDVKSSAYKNWLKVIKDKEMSFTENELQAIKFYSEAKPFLPVHTITGNLILLQMWANDGIDIVESLLLSIETKTLIKGKMAIMHDKKGNKLLHKSIAEKRLQQIKRETEELNQKIGIIGGFAGYSDDSINDLMSM